MHPKRILSIIKDNLVKLSPEDKSKLINLLLDGLNDPSNIILPARNNAARVINVNEIMYVQEPKKGQVYIVTVKEKMKFENTSYNLLEFLEEHHDNFVVLNSGLIVNIDKLKSYDSDYLKVFFINDTDVAVTAAAIRNIVKNILGKEKDLAKDTFNGRFQYW